mmetsp:Transcript_18145/g.26999  ORF Transcript_18145/g.26999 Transcript_18145/m.26999 type:complete len:241 (+) Transcript_18145:2-724(+)
MNLAASKRFFKTKKTSSKKKSKKTRSSRSGGKNEAKKSPSGNSIVSSTKPTSFEKSVTIPADQQAVESSDDDELSLEEVEIVCRGTAICDFDPTSYVQTMGDDIEFLAFKTGQEIDVVCKDDSGWWEGVLSGQGELGVFPGSHIQVIETFEENATKDKDATTDKTNARDSTDHETTTNKNVIVASTLEKYQHLMDADLASMGGDAEKLCNLVQDLEEAIAQVETEYDKKSKEIEQSNSAK